MTIGCVSRRGRRETCYELRVCVCARSAAYSQYALLPMHEKEWFQFEDQRKRVRGYDDILGHKELHDWVYLQKLYTRVQNQELNNWVCILLYGKMDTYLPWSFPNIYTSHCPVHLCYPCIFIPPPINVSFGKHWAFPSQLLPGCLCQAYLFSIISI